MSTANEQQICRTDVLIFGGGVAGLWLLGRLRTAGYRALLLETARLGEGQTRYAQGIIHGGTKYSLQGAISDAAKSVASMPARWRGSLSDGSELDLGAVRLLSEHHYLWSSSSLTSRMTGFFASRAMHARTETRSGDKRPEVFRDLHFRGHVYALDEPVIDTVSLVRGLAEPRRERTLQVHWPEGVQIEVDQGVQVQLHDREAGSMLIHANWLVCCAGAGNQALLTALGKDAPQMQRRPVHMVLARGELPPLYAHCLGLGPNPRITVTTHYHSSGDAIWYVGGQLAEDGAERTPAAQVEAARQEFAQLLPWVDLSNVRWQTLRVDRAEPRQREGARPSEAFVERDGPVITAWPVKMVLAPLMADRVLAAVRERGARSDCSDELPAWPRPDYAPAPWEELQWS